MWLLLVYLDAGKNNFRLPHTFPNGTFRFSTFRVPGSTVLYVFVRHNIGYFFRYKIFGHEIQELWPEMDTILRVLILSSRKGSTCLNFSNACIDSFGILTIAYPSPNCAKSHVLLGIMLTISSRAVKVALLEFWQFATRFNPLGNCVILSSNIPMILASLNIPLDFE